jgi:hypothetical protein
MTNVKAGASLLINLIYTCQCVLVSISAIKIQTIGPISVKFGTGILLEWGKGA